MIRGIIFDCFGVLYGGSLSTLTSMCPPDRLAELRDLNKSADYGYITTTDYLSGIAEIFGKRYEEIEAILRAKHQRNEELVEFVRELNKQSEYHVALLSNVGSGTVERLFGNELNELFDTVVLSYKENLAKPNPAIFRLTAERMSVPPEECVMIDDLESNCDGAEIAGMQSIQHITNDGTRIALAKMLQEKA